MAEKIEVGTMTNKGLVISTYKNTNAYTWENGLFGYLSCYLSKELTEIPFDPTSTTLKNKTINFSHNVEVGADPEVFVVDKRGVVIPAFSFLPVKENGKVDKSYGGGQLEKCYNDGFQAEFSINPVNCLSYGIDAMHRQLKAIHTAARKVEPTARLTAATALEIPEALLLMSPEEYVRIGCAPSMNAYGAMGEQIVDGRALPYRFAGAHIHIGSKDVTPENAIRTVKCMDALVGCMSVALFGSQENDVRRRFYGIAGEYRLPKHGLEYRVVSAGMLRHPVYCNLLMDTARMAFRCGVSRVFEVLGWFDETTVKKAINESDVKLARKVLKKNEVLLKQIFDKIYGAGNTANIWLLLMGEKKIKLKRTMEADWYFAKGWINHGEAINCSVRKAVYA